MTMKNLLEAEWPVVPIQNRKKYSNFAELNTM